MQRNERQYFRQHFGRFIAKEKTKSVSDSRIEDMLATRFDKQRAFIESKAKRKAALCTRRAGKTEIIPAWFFSIANKYPESLIQYIAITRMRAIELQWRHLWQFNQLYGFDARANETQAKFFFPNGSEIRLVGADKINEAEKRRGDKSRVVAIDEAQIFPPVILRRLVDDILGPTLEDLGGTMALLGTPGVVCDGYWYEATRNEDKDSIEARQHGWEVHEWSVLDNPFMGHMKERLPELMAERKWTPKTPTYMREWLGRWVNDTEALFYQFDFGRNTYDGALPVGHQWHYTLGVDLGTKDAFAIQAWAFSRTHPHIFEVYGFKQSGMIPSQWAEEIQKARQKFNPRKIVVDTGGLGRAITDEFKARFGLPCEAAEKVGKASFVELLNGELLQGVVKVLPQGHLAGEWSVLPKNPDKPTEEHPSFPNHSCDAALYAWRESLHFLGRHPKDVKKDDKEEILRDAKAREQRAIEAVKRKKFGQEL